ncbi:AAA family ATPase [Streptomyces coelicoflavus]|nr:AAA family ATPase [Streptomyces coelicoflavus]
MLKLRKLKLLVQTAGPVCGTELEFSPGLNILRADNSSGKSTCLQSIIYALGLEGMLSPSRDVPLPHAMTDSLEVEGSEYQVLSSEVALEMQNSRDEIITVRRAVRSERFDRTLIRVTRGPALTNPYEEYSTRDFFVRRQGAAQREAGFHHELANFLGWDLPRVTRMDGSEGSLYLECLFPYFFVEQKHGWSGVQARIPAYLGIQDVSKRSAEFILNLDAMETILERQRLESAVTLIESDWRTTEAGIEDLARRGGVLVRGVPKKPTRDWRLDDRVASEVAANTGWIPLSVEIDRLAEKLEAAAQRRVAATGEAAPEIERALLENQEQSVQLALLLSNALEELEQSKRRSNSIELRIEAMEEDLRKHKDAALLRHLGSSEHVEELYENCPTCGQSLPDGFEITDFPLSIEDNISHLEKELATFRSMAEDARRVVAREQVRAGRIREELVALRATIRSQKDALVSPSDLPDAATLAERIQLEGRLSSLRGLRDTIDSSLEELTSLSQTWRRNKDELSRIRNRDLNAADAAKIDALRGSLVSQLRSYGFRSMEPHTVDISEKTYRPVHEGFDLGFDLSASDMIRVIWAYLFSFMEVSREVAGNHPQLLVFDEPRQQEAARPSFEQLLRRAAMNGAQGSQVLFATSEEERGLGEMLQGLPHSMMSVPRGEKLIRPLSLPLRG